MKKWSIQQEDITVHIYVAIIGAPRYLKQVLTKVKAEIDSNTLIKRDFNTPLSTLARSSRKNVNKKTTHYRQNGPNRHI